MRRNQEELERLAAFFDGNGDGNISASDLCSCLKKAVGEDLSIEEAEALIKSLDVNGDGVLSLDELASSLSGEREEADCLKEAFRMYEDDFEGRITPRSLKRMLSRLGMPRQIDQCRTMICRFDSNGDGSLCFEEFKMMMMTTLPN